jgi:hypothetical protein
MLVLPEALRSEPALETQPPSPRGQLLSAGPSATLFVRLRPVLLAQPGRTSSLPKASSREGPVPHPVLLRFCGIIDEIVKPNERFAVEES